MKVVILDSLPGNPGDICWDALEQVGTLSVFERTAPDEIVERAKDADALVTNKCRITAEIIKQLPNLKLICVTATGFDNVDGAAARSNGVSLCNVPAYSTASTAQTSIALLLELTQHCGLHSEAVHRGEWATAPAFSFWKTPLVELDGKVMVLIGSGNIGAAVGRVAEAFGMRVVSAIIPGRPAGSECGFERVSLADALAQADVVSLHCPLSDLTKGLIDSSFLQQLKPTAFLVNAARGPVVVEDDVAAALHAGDLAGYATDVLSCEPPSEDHPLIGAPNCVITPHLAWATQEARQRLWNVIAENIRLYKSGAPQNVVND